LPISGKLLIIVSPFAASVSGLTKPFPSGIGGQNHSLTFYPRRFLGAKFTNTVIFLPTFRFKTLGNS
jgi:hypothetical protein